MSAVVALKEVPDLSRREERQSVTGHERLFGQDQIIVSKTDTKGLMTYVNDVFIEISGYDERELIGKPHSYIRHPHMPSCIFKLLWETIKSGQEIFAYVMNRCANGDHYWVLAHVTPTLGPAGEIVGYHSNRRLPRREALAVIQPLYKKLLDEERRLSGRAGMEAGYQMLTNELNKQGTSYEKFVLSL